MNILFTVCGRAGSKGFKNKNLKKMRGIPLVYYTLASIRGFMDSAPQHNVTVALNTDSVELINLVERQRILDVIKVERRKELAGDVVSKVEVIKDTFLSFPDKEYDMVVDLDITSPVRRVQDIEGIISEFGKERYDVVFSVVEARRSPYFNMVEEKADGFYRKICESGFTARQQAPESYEMNASIYAYDPEFLKGIIDKTILDYNCGIYEMPDYLVLDIDSEKDFEMMSFLHEHYSNTDKGIKDVYEIAQQICESSEG